jgi:uncharacterized damage-inducible protein DinB
VITCDHALFLFQYNQWANRKILDACAALSPEQFSRDLGTSFQSVRGTLVHMYGAEWVWQERIAGRWHPSLPAATGFPDCASVRAMLEEKDRDLIDYVSKLTASEMESVLQYKNLEGKEFSSPIWQILHQLSNHGTYHRGQIVTLLRQLGAKAVSTDIIGFYRERAAAAKS